MREFPESDWRLLRALHPVALDRYCTQVLGECAAIVRSSGASAHDRYSRLFRLLEARDGRITHAFGDMRRSTAVERLAAMIGLGVLTDGSSGASALRPGTRPAFSPRCIDRLERANRFPPPRTNRRTTARSPRLKQSVDLTDFDADRVPLVDLGRWRRAYAGRRQVSDAMGRACREWAFFYVVAHGVDGELQERLEAHSRACHKGGGVGMSRPSRNISSRSKPSSADRLAAAGSVPIDGWPGSRVMTAGSWGSAWGSGVRS